MSSISEPVDKVLSLLDGVRESGKDQWMARCPCRNDDSNPSLAIAQGEDGTALLHCHRGNACSVDEICKSIGMTPRELFTEDEDWKPVARPRSAGKIETLASSAKKKMGKKIEKVYPYTDEQGTLLYEKVRFRLDDGSKSFANRQPDSSRSGEYIWNLKNPPVRRVLYRLPELNDAISKSRSLSEYARQAVLGSSMHSLQKTAPDPTVSVLAECLERLVARMNELDRKLSAILGESAAADC